MRVIDEIVSSPGDKVVLDFGAGTGGGWAGTLQHHPEIKLYCYEPSRSAVTLAERVPGANIIHQEELQDGSLNVDYMVSFSVFEHVYDRRAYLEGAHKALAKSGRFFLNYDDGHFRKALDLNAPAQWGGNLREHLTNLGADVWPKLGMIGKYQKRVVRSDVDLLIRQVGFRVSNSRYENLVSFKNLSRAVPCSGRADFTQLWLQVENDLNRSFSADVPTAHLGDNSILWREMSSRTLELRRTNQILEVNDSPDLASATNVEEA